MVPVNSQSNTTVQKSERERERERERESELNARTLFEVHLGFFFLFFLYRGSLNIQFFLFIGSISAFPFLSFVTYPLWLLLKCQGQAGLLLPTLMKNSQPTFRQVPHGAVSSRELSSFPLPLFGLSVTSAHNLTFFLWYAIFSLWITCYYPHFLYHPHLSLSNKWSKKQENWWQYTRLYINGRKEGERWLTSFDYCVVH